MTVSRHGARLAAAVGTVLIAASAGLAEAPRRQAPLAQQLADEMAGAHSELIRIGIHVTPPGTSENVIIASNVRAKIGQKSDPEDLAAMTKGEPVVLREGEAVDVTLPLHDSAGRLVGAVGLTLKMAPGLGERAAIERARAIAKQLESRIPSLRALFQQISY